MSRVVGPYGDLQDYIGRTGDPSPATIRPGHPSRRQRWGNRVKLSNNPNGVFGPAKGSATVIDTGDLGRTHLFLVQMRFAAIAADGTPALPFFDEWPLSNTTLTINVRRGVDDLAPVAIDQFVMGQNGVGDTLPFDVLAARDIGVDLVLGNPAGQTSLWVEAITTIVTTPPIEAEVIGWPLRFGGTQIAAVATPGNVRLMASHNARAQFIIVNTSTNADLILSLDKSVIPATGSATWGPPPVGSIILPKNVFATYESPVGGWRGEVWGSWNNAAPDNGAMVTEGLFR